MSDGIPDAINAVCERIREQEKLVREAKKAVREARFERDRLTKHLSYDRKILLELCETYGDPESLTFRTSVYTAYVSLINNKRVVKIRPAKGLDDV